MNRGFIAALLLALLMPLAARGVSPPYKILKLLRKEDPKLYERRIIQMPKLGLFLPMSLSILCVWFDCGAQIPKPRNTVTARTREQVIPSTDMFSFSNCVADGGYIYWLRGEDQLVRVNRDDGKYPQTLVTTNTSIGNFAVDGNNVYYMSENKSENVGGDYNSLRKGELRKIDLASGSISRLIGDFDYPGDQFIATDATHVFFLREGKKEGIIVSRLSKNGGEPERVTAGLQHPTGFAVDDRYVYWCDYYNNSVWKVAKTGGEQTVLFDGNEYRAVPISMAADEQSLFLLTQRGNIYKIEKGSGKATRLYIYGKVDFDETAKISLDKDGVLWPLGNRVMRLSKNGGEPTVVSVRPAPVRCVVADDKYIYWDEQKKGLMKIPK